MTSTGPRVAVVQFAPTADKQANLRRIGALAAEAAAAGAQLVVFPEYSSYFTDPMDSSFAENAEALDGSFVTGLRALARELSIHLVAGIAEGVADSERFSNTLVAIEPGGHVVATYRKQHLYDAFGQKESHWVIPGAITEPETFTVGDLTVGLQTCYDLRFPEITRSLVDAGAGLILVPSEWVAGPNKLHAWRTLLAARAIENTVYFAAADHPPPIGVGSSVILDPQGLVLAELGGEQGIASAMLDSAELAAVRARNPSLALRRYGVHPL